MVEITPGGYAEKDAEQFPLGGLASRTDSDVRTAFQHDVDRILYSEEFRALGGKTQVVSASQRGNVHNRLTHSLKVAQVGKRMAVLLGDRAKKEYGSDCCAPDPDLVEAACLLHDIGHPPFGHIGEEEITKALDGDGRHVDGFQANAQNLRIATLLGVRKDRGPRGLHLTRAALDASIKYPWHRSATHDTYSDDHWGCYASEDEALLWVLDSGDIPASPATKADAARRPVEGQIMDWADEVTYACHDLEDFYRAGLIPLDRVLDLPLMEDPRSKAPRELPHETRQFMDYLAERAKKKGRDIDEEAIRRRLVSLQNIVMSLFPYESTRAGRGRTATATSGLLNYFLGPEAKLVHIDGAPDGVLTRYSAQLEVPGEMRAMCELLNDMIRCYVIDRPGLATQQQGQRRIVTDLVQWYGNDPKRLLPDGRREEWEEHRDDLRAAADTVSSMSEAEAVMLHRRMSGVDYGQLTDR